MEERRVSKTRREERRGADGLGQKALTRSSATTRRYVTCASCIVVRLKKRNMSNTFSYCERPVSRLPEGPCSSMSLRKMEKSGFSVKTFG